MLELKIKFMKKLLLLPILLVLAACDARFYGCKPVSALRQQEAQSMYNAFGTSIIEMKQERAEKIFGCNYRRGDDIYVYKTFWGEKYILTRYSTVITYEEEES